MQPATTDFRDPLLTVEQLEANLSAPPEFLLEAFGDLQGDLLLLGAGGKMGPTLARMAKRASQAAGTKRRVVAVSRYQDAAARQRLEAWGVETLSCDLLDEEAVERLPDAENVVFMAGMKFGSSAQPALTWAMNCYLPVLVSRRYRHSRIAAFSSGNVYGLTPVAGGGSRESDCPQPVGEYAMTVLGRERMFEYFSQLWNIPLVLLRLNYATELRYGVLVDLARQVWNEQPVDLSMGYVNVLWQGEANAYALAALNMAAVPALALNLAGGEVLRIRQLAEQFGQLMNRQPQFVGQEAEDALLSNADHCHQLLAPPEISADQMVRWTAEWVMHGGANLGKPTHFQSRDGKF